MAPETASSAKTPATFLSPPAALSPVVAASKPVAALLMPGNVRTKAFAGAAPLLATAKYGTNARMLAATSSTGFFGASWMPSYPIHWGSRTRWALGAAGPVDGTFTSMGDVPAAICSRARRARSISYLAASTARWAPMRPTRSTDRPRPVVAIDSFCAAAMPLFRSPVCRNVETPEPKALICLMGFRSLMVPRNPLGACGLGWGLGASASAPMPVGNT